jgi:hypothetical protein
VLCPKMLHSQRIALQSRQRAASSPICGPAVLLEEVVAGLLQAKVRSQFGYVQGFSRERILGLPAQMLDNGGALVRLASFCLPEKMLEKVIAAEQNMYLFSGAERQNLQ